MREPTAMIRTRPMRYPELLIRRMPESGRLPSSLDRTRRLNCGSRGLGPVVPQPLESVKLAHPGQHNVNDDVLQIDQNPFTVSLALFAQRAKTRLLGFLEDAIGDGLDVPVGIAGRNDHGVGYIGQPSYIQHLHIDGFHIVERGRYEVLQRGSALWLRGAARACASDHVFKWFLLTSSGNAI